MKFTREELAIIQRSLGNASFLLSQHPKVTDLKKRIQSELLKDECPITVRSPESVSA